jgi:hypothetical protein
MQGYLAPTARDLGRLFYDRQVAKRRELHTDPSKRMLVAANIMPPSAIPHSLSRQ